MAAAARLTAAEAKLEEKVNGTFDSIRALAEGGERDLARQGTAQLLERSRFLLYVRRFLTTRLVTASGEEALTRALARVGEVFGVLTDFVVGTANSFAEAYLEDQPTGLWSLQPPPESVDTGDLTAVAIWLLPRYEEALATLVPISEIARLHVDLTDLARGHGQEVEKAQRLISELLERWGWGTLDEKTTRRLGELVGSD